MSAQAVLEQRFVDLVAQELSVQPRQVQAAAELFAEGSTVPFVARYRKEATGGLDDEKLEALAKRREYFLELTARRDAILQSIDEQGKLTPELEESIRAATTKQELEDLYLPYKKKRRTRAEIARERGLEPLADRLLEHAPERTARPAELAAGYVDGERDVPDAEAALAGARDILAERLAEDARVRSDLRDRLRRDAVLEVKVVTGKESEGAVYRDYFEHAEPAKDVPSHRMLAILRGEREGFLLSDLTIDDATEASMAARFWEVPLDTPCGREVEAASLEGYRRLLRPSITNEVRGELRERAEAGAIDVFRDNLEALLLQPPLGQVPVMGLDPGLRTGTKLAVVDGTGRVVATDVVYAVVPSGKGGGKEGQERAAETITRLIRDHGVQAVAVGNGTGSRETERFARKAVQEAGIDGVTVAIVPETGASIYSASAVAREELPDMDVSLRGAVSIARRLQDPLAELVKIEPKSLGVGQYQHDVDQRALGRELDLAVEGAVNRVGVELNTASGPLLARVSGLTERVARAVVAHRDQRGAFASREDLLEVAGLGPKTFELAAGFLRVRGGTHPLDSTAVHPERYPVVEAMAEELGLGVERLVGEPEVVQRIDFSRFRDEAAGLGTFTLEDIREELVRPGRDPRPEFEAPEWREGVETIDDLATGMVLEGRVSNVTNFGAFVDIGVKRDGLVHLSELSQRWVDDPREVVQVGQIVKVKVMEVDRDRERIGLSIKALEAPAGGGRPARGGASKSGKGGNKGKDGRRGGGGGRGRQGTGAPPPTKSASVDDLMTKFNRRG